MYRSSGPDPSGFQNSGLATQLIGPAISSSSRASRSARSRRIASASSSSAAGRPCCACVAPPIAAMMWFMPSCMLKSSLNPANLSRDISASLSDPSSSHVIPRPSTILLMCAPFPFAVARSANRTTSSIARVRAAGVRAPLGGRSSIASACTPWSMMAYTRSIAIRGRMW